MTKKAILFSMFFLLLFLTGCDLFSQTTTTNTLGTSTSTTTTTSEGSTDLTTQEVIDLSYVNLFDNQVYKKFVIHFSEANFLKLIDDMENYNDIYGSYRDNTIQEVDIEYTDSLGNIIVMNEVGFRTKGNIFSRRLPVVKDNQGNIVGYQQVSFQLEFNDTFDYLENSTQYKELKERRGFDLEQLNFKYVNSWDFGIVTESIAYDLYREAGVLTSATSYAIIYFDVDGTEVPYGLFLLQEPIDDVFVKRYFGRNQDGSVGDLYKCVWQTEPATLKPNYMEYSLGVSDYNDGYRKTYQLKTNKDTSNFSSFTTFVDRLNDTTVINYQNVLEQILDIDSLLRAYAIGFLIGSPDDYRSDANNYYLYFYEGQAIYIPFDMDQSMGYGWDPFGNHGLDLDVLSYAPAQGYIGDQSDLPMAYNILEIETYKDAYLNYVLEFTDPTNGIFDVQNYIDRHNLIKGLYESEMNSAMHLGVTYFSVADRTYSVDYYYTQKTTNSRVDAIYYLNH